MENLKENILTDLMCKRICKEVALWKSNYNAGRSDQRAIAEYLKPNNKKKNDYLTENNIEERFADTRDTLCYATYENQSAVYGLLN